MRKEICLFLLVRLLNTILSFMPAFVTTEHIFLTRCRCSSKTEASFSANEVRKKSKKIGTVSMETFEHDDLLLLKAYEMTLLPEDR